MSILNDKLNYYDRAAATLEFIDGIPYRAVSNGHGTHVGQVAGSIDKYRMVSVSIGGYRRKIPASKINFYKITGRYAALLDHINRDKTNDRMRNLREVTASENCRNKKHLNGTSKYQGVCWNSSSYMWQAALSIEGKTTYLGSSKVEEEAARMYDTAVIEQGYQEHTPLNFPEEV